MTPGPMWMLSIAEVGQLAQDLRLRLAVLAEGHAVEMRRAVDHVDAQGRRRADVPLHAVVELGQLLLDGRMAGRIEAGQPTQADEALEQGDRIDAVRLGRCRPPSAILRGPGGRCRRHRLNIVLACRATRTSAGFQNR